VTRGSLIAASVHRPRTLPTLRPFREVFLLSHRIRLGQPSTKFVVDVLQDLEAKGVEVIARRKRLDAAEPGTLEATREHNVAIEPRSTRRHLGK